MKKIILTAFAAAAICATSAEARMPYYDVGFKLIGGPCNGKMGKYRYEPVTFENPKIGDMKVFMPTIMTDLDCGISKGDRLLGSIEITSFEEHKFLSVSYDSIPKETYHWDKVIARDGIKEAKQFFETLEFTTRPH